MREYSTGGTVRKHASGKWQALIKYRDHTKRPDGSTETGPWRQRTKLLDVRCNPTNNRGERAALKALAAWRAELEAAEPGRAQEEALRAAGELTASSTVSEHVGRLIDTLEASKAIERSTAATYRRCAELIDRGANPKRYDPTPGLGSVALKDLTRPRVQAWANGLARAYGAVNVNKAVTLLRRTCREAVDSDLIAKDPTRGVKAPKAEAADPNAIAPADVARLLADLDAPRDRERPQTVVAMKIAIGTGLRRGEVCGLTWEDVDLEGGTLTVRRAVAGAGDAESYVKVPKTPKSRRTVPMPPKLVADIAEWRAEVEAECARAGERFRPTLFVCGEVDGSYLEPHQLWRAYKRRVDRLGIVGTRGRSPTFHDIRHTYATMAVATGADVKSVSSLMGHADAAMTLNVYASADAEAKRRAVERLGEAMGWNGGGEGAEGA